MIQQTNPSPVVATFNRNNNKNTMKKRLFKFGAFCMSIVLLLTLLALGMEADSPQQKQLKQAFRLVISDTFEGYQYEPIQGTTVVFYLEKVKNEAGKDEWNIQQIAGPWGNSVGLGDPSVEFNQAYANEFMLAFQEATRVSLWRTGLTKNFEWTARVVDVRDHISKRPQKYNE